MSDTNKNRALLTIIALQDGYQGEDIGRMRGYQVAGNISRQALGMPEKTWAEPTVASPAPETHVASLLEAYDFPHEKRSENFAALVGNFESSIVDHAADGDQFADYLASGANGLFIGKFIGVEFGPVTVLLEGTIGANVEVVPGHATSMQLPAHNLAKLILFPVDCARPPQTNVKPLEWHSEPPYRVARPLPGLHYATEVVWPESGKGPNEVILTGQTMGRKSFASLPEAQAAAQSDFDQRINALLTTAPQNHVHQLKKGGSSAFEDHLAPAATSEGVSRGRATNDRDTLCEPISGSPQSNTTGIYIASKTKHADRWRRIRDNGVPIISTWIDEAGPGESSDLSDLWRRCILEASTASALVLYREPEDVLKGGWIELGAALACGVPVLAVGIEDFTVSHDARIRHFPDLDHALAYAVGIPHQRLATEGRP